MPELGFTCSLSEGLHDLTLWCPHRCAQYAFSVSSKFEDDQWCLPFLVVDWTELVQAVH